MMENEKYWKDLVSMALRLLIEQKEDAATSVIRNGKLDVRCNSYDNWNGGIYYWDIVFGLKFREYHTQKEKEDHIMFLNTHPENRKKMVKAICELTGMNAMYLFTPTYAYQIGPITVSRDGNIDCEDEAMLSAIKPMRLGRSDMRMWV